MPEIVASVLRKLLLIFALLNMLLCPVLFGLGTFAPDKLSFLEPVVCPAGMHLDRVTETRTDMRGTVTSLDAACTDGRQKVDATNKMALFVCGLPIMGGVLLVVWALASPSKKTMDTVDSKVQG
ncbi:MAG: hypothetical protein GY832_25690 [Chloroflexi bacterium]|nr:hypothetical protein [Chloroflexota bacterium]